MNIKYRISLARRTSYSFINNGLHGINRLNPKTSYVIYRTYAMPRLSYGLEITSFNKTQIKELEIYHLNTLRQIQSLPKRTATASVFMLLGALTIEAELHKRLLGLLYAVLTSDNQCLQDACSPKTVSVQFRQYSQFFSTLCSKYWTDIIFQQ